MATDKSFSKSTPYKLDLYNSRIIRVKYKFFTLITFIAVISGCAQKEAAQPTIGLLGNPGAAGRTRKVFAEIKMIEVKQKMDRGEDITILDVRSAEEFQSGHLKNAVHIPISQLKDRVKELDPDKETVVYCHSGFRSRVGGNILVSTGFTKVRDMAAGIQGWKYEIVK
jgi:rhodanese-related sulfurtransferase